MTPSTYALDAPHGATLEEAKALVGGKAANLGVMARELGLPVPPGFVITTATCRSFLASGWPADLDDELRARMREVEVAVGRRFGDPSDPLLVSVRSGAPVSMPGMMDSILDLGMNDATTSGLASAAGDEAFARRCRERFEASFRSIVGVSDVPADPWLQLRLAIEAVFRSWDGATGPRVPPARGHPRRSRDRRHGPGDGVRQPRLDLGDRGRLHPGPRDRRAEPVRRRPVRCPGRGRRRRQPSDRADRRARRASAVAAATCATTPNGSSATTPTCATSSSPIEDGRLWLLQVRVGKRSPQAALRIAVEMAEDPTFPLDKGEAVRRVLPLLTIRRSSSNGPASRSPLAVRGLPASPGIGSGPIATDPETAQAAADAGETPILVRAETSPDDVHGMARAAGVLTSRGGLASHAAVVARGWGIPAVVGAAGLDVGDGRVAFGHRTLAAGDVITVDGTTGEVFEGSVGLDGHDRAGGRNTARLGE